MADRKGCRRLEKALRFLRGHEKSRRNVQNSFEQLETVEFGSSKLKCLRTNIGQQHLRRLIKAIGLVAVGRFVSRRLIYRVDISVNNQP